MNKVILSGNVGQDPEIRYTQSGTAVSNFSMATSERYKDKEGNRQEQTEWHRCVAWGKLAEICGDILHKGDKILVTGKIQTKKWKDQANVERYNVEIVLSEMEVVKFASDKGESAGGEPETPNGYTGTGEDVPF